MVKDVHRELEPLRKDISDLQKGQEDQKKINAQLFAAIQGHPPQNLGVGTGAPPSEAGSSGSTRFTASRVEWNKTRADFKPGWI
eukprot:5492193-Pyramimonas_sp.AAC.1